MDRRDKGFFTAAHVQQLGERETEITLHQALVRTRRKEIAVHAVSSFFQKQVWHSFCPHFHRRLSTADSAASSNTQSKLTVISVPVFQICSHPAVAFSLCPNDDGKRRQGVTTAKIYITTTKQNEIPFRKASSRVPLSGWFRNL